MSFYIAAWVTSGNIKMLQTDTNPITKNHAPDMRSEKIIIAEADGDYVDAGVLLPQLSVINDKIIGIDITSQSVTDNPLQTE